MGKQEEKMLSEELKEAIYDAARAGALTAYGQTAGSYVNYFKATETLLHNFKTLATLVADEDDYCDVEYHKGKKTFSTSARPTGYVEWKSETEIVRKRLFPAATRRTITTHLSKTSRNYNAAFASMAYASPAVNPRANVFTMQSD